jgi:DNA primase
MSSPVDLIKERLNIVDVVSSYITLIPAGKNYKAKSPFKQERTSSFYVSPDKGLYHCFSTNKGGDMFTFVQEMEGLDFKGALRVLADKAGVSLINFNPKEKEEKDKLYEIMEEATKFFQNKLKESSEALEYIKSRAIEEKTIEDFRIGFVSEGWRHLYDFLKGKYSDKELASVGLVKMTDKGAYDTFRNRIMFPITDTSGRTIAFSGRIFKDDGKSAKYVNSPDTPLFNKSDILFGIDKAKNYIRKYNFTTIVEGQFDVIALHQAGFRNTVAVSGTALSDSLEGKNSSVNNLGVIKRLSNNLVLAFDSDVAGVNAAKRSAHIGISLGMDVKIIDIKEGKDPADIIKDFGKDEWSSYLKNAKHVILFYAEKIKNNSKDGREIAKRAKDELLPEITLIESEIEKGYFIKEVSDILGISEQNIKADLEGLKNVGAPPPKKEVEVSRGGESFETGIEKEIWGVYVAKDKSEEIAKKIIELSTQEEFEKLKNKFEKKESEFIFGDTDYGVGMDEKFENWQLFYLKKKYEKIKEERMLAESENDEEKTNELLREESKIRKEIDKITSSRFKNNS